MDDDLQKKAARKRFYILEDWEILSVSDGNGALKLCLTGIAFGDGRPVGGDAVRTSALSSYRLQQGRMVVETRSGSEYMLGMRNLPQEEDKRRLTRYLDLLAKARNEAFLNGTSEIQTSIHEAQQGRINQESGKSVA